MLIAPYLQKAHESAGLVLVENISSIQSATTVTWFTNGAVLPDPGSFPFTPVFGVVIVGIHRTDYQVTARYKRVWTDCGRRSLGIPTIHGSVTLHRSG